MNYGLYLSAAGALSNLNRLDVITNNLVNVETIGYKPDMVTFRQRLPERVASGSSIESQLLLERLGGSPSLSPTRLNLKQGTLRETGNDLDVAVEGEGFFVVKDADGRMLLTRDGRFSLNAEGELVMTNTGMPLQNTRNQPIRLGRDGNVEIGSDGRIRQNGTTVATIRIVGPQDPAALVKIGGSLLRDPNLTTDNNGDVQPRLMQGYLENSGVETISTLRNLVGATKSVQGNIKMMQYQDHIMGQAINTMGRVA